MQLGTNEAIARHLARNPFRDQIARPVQRRIERPLEERIRAALDDLPDDQNKVALFYLLSRARRKVALLAHGLLSTKIESVFPYLDNRVVECVLSHDPAVRIGRDYQARGLAEDFPAMADIPHSHLERPALLKEYYLPVTGWDREYTRRLVVRSSRAALAHPAFLAWLAWKARVMAVIQVAASVVPWLSRRICERGWMLMRLLHVVSWHESLGDAAPAQARLARARRYVMSDPQGVVPGRTVASPYDRTKDRAS